MNYIIVQYKIYRDVQIVYRKYSENEIQKSKLIN